VLLFFSFVGWFDYLKGIITDVNTLPVFLKFAVKFKKQKCQLLKLAFV